MAILVGGIGITFITTSSNVSETTRRERESFIVMMMLSVLENDEEGYQLWKAMGLPDDKIVRCGMEDNFWSMGDGEGPCGPCTEIFWDTQDKSLDDPWLEIWNLVFMENYRTADGQITKLPSPCIDTGMGLERVASVLQVSDDEIVHCT